MNTQIYSYVFYNQKFDSHGRLILPLVPGDKVLTATAYSKDKDETRSCFIMNEYSKVTIWFPEADPIMTYQVTLICPQ